MPRMSRPPRSVESVKNPAVQRFRDAATGAGDLMLAEGVRLVREALDAGLQVVEAAVSPRLGDDDLRQRLQEAADSFLECTDAVLQRMSALESPQGVAALPFWKTPAKDAPVRSARPRATPPGTLTRMSM